MGEWYSDLSRHVRTLISQRVSDRWKYKSLKNPNSRSNGYDDGRYRANVLFRPSNLPPSGTRTLNVGSNEILFVMQGVSRVGDHFKDGIEFDYKKNPYRIVMGERIRSRDFGNDLLRNFGRYFVFAKRHLNRGSYEHFVDRTLEIVDNEISVFRDLISDGFYD